MRKVSANELQEIGTRLFDAAGSPHEESQLVSEILVRSNLMGHDSHGVIRILQYLVDIESKKLFPGAPFEVIHETASTAVVDGNGGWGQVAAYKAMLLTIEKARQSAVGTVVIRNSQHVGRLGEYPAMAASQQMIGSAFVNSYGGGRDCVVPWGGVDPRLAPNPMAWAAPSGEDWPVMVDLTTSVFSEGKIRVARYSGKELPEGCIVDREGNPTTNPADFYNGGALLLLGGVVGHKGFALNLMVELMGGALSGVGCRGQETTGNGNGVFFQALNISDFIPVEQFVKSVQELSGHVKSSRKSAGVEEILIPGEPEYRIQQQRLKEGVPLSDSLWDEILAAAKKLGVNL